MVTRKMRRAAGQYEDIVETLRGRCCEKPWRIGYEDFTVCEAIFELGWLLLLLHRYVYIGRKWLFIRIVLLNV